MMTEVDAQNKGNRSRIANYEKILANNPRSYIFAQLAEEQLKQGEVDLALSICRDGLRYNPDFSDGLYVYGAALYKKGLREQAIAIFSLILLRAPDHYLAREALIRMGYDQANIQTLVAHVAENPPKLDFLEAAPAPAAAGPMSLSPADLADVKPRAGDSSSQTAVRTAYRAEGLSRVARLDGASEENWSLGVKLLLAVGVAALVAGLIWGGIAYTRWLRDTEIAETMSAATQEMQRDRLPNYRSALTRLETLIAKEPEVVAPRAMALSIYARLLLDFDPKNVDWQAHMESLSASLTGGPQGDPSLTAALGWRALSQNKPAEVRYLLDAALDRRQERPELLALEADLAAYDRHFEQAVKLFDRALHEDPAQQGWAYRRALAAFALKDYAKVKDSLEPVFRGSNDHYRARFLLFETDLARGRAISEIKPEFDALWSAIEKSLPPLEHAHGLLLKARLLVESDAKQAAEVLKSSLEIAPGAASYAFSAKLAFDAKRYDDARTAIQSAMTLEPDERAHHAFLGRVYLALGNTGEALKELEQGVDEASDSFELLLAAGDAAAALRYFDRAVAYYERASLLAPKNQDIKKKLILAMIEKGDLKEAQKRVEKLLVENPGEALGHYLNGRLYMAGNRPAEAAKAFERALAIDPKHRDTWLEKVRLFIDEEAYEKAYDALRRLSSENPGDEDVLALLATYTLASGANKQAHDLYEHLTTKTSQNPAYRLQLAYLDFVEAKALGAKTHTEQIKQRVEDELARDPNLGLGHILRGVFLFLEGDARRAEPQIEHGIQLDSKNAYGHYWMGRVKLEGNDKTWAKNEFEVALECQKFFPLAQIEIGRILMSQGHAQNAGEWYAKAQKVFALFPEEKAQRANTLLRLAEVEFFQNRNDKGMRLLKDVQALEPNNAEVYYLQASQAIGKFRDPARALSLLKKCLELDRDFAPAYYEQGLIYYSKDQNKESAEAFRHYLRLAPKGPLADDARTRLEKLD